LGPFRSARHTRDRKKRFLVHDECESDARIYKKTGVEITREFEDQKKVLFSLERYLVFIARMRYLSATTPDSEYWIWLPHGRYDRSGMLIAGFDRYGTFNVHGWMPQFCASFLGARYGSLPENTI
jgi:hypothetical protein